MLYCEQRQAVLAEQLGEAVLEPVGGAEQVQQRLLLGALERLAFLDLLLQLAHLLPSGSLFYTSTIRRGQGPSHEFAGARLSLSGGMSGPAPGGEILRKRGTMASTKADALTKVTEFEQRSGGTDWLHVKKDDLVTGLKDRLDTPNNINTSAVNLCGPGAFFRCLAMDDPVMYVNAVIDLWCSNKALIGKREFKASHGLRIAAPGTTPVGGLGAAGEPARRREHAAELQQQRGRAERADDAVGAGEVVQGGRLHGRDERHERAVHEGRGQPDRRPRACGWPGSGCAC